jgi:hypothetical protein
MRRVRSRLRRVRSHQSRRIPLDPVRTRGVFHHLTHPVFKLRTIAPHGPETSVIVDQIVVLIDAISGANIAHNYVLDRESRELVKINLVMIQWRPVAGKHQGRPRVGNRIGIL